MELIRKNYFLIISFISFFFIQLIFYNYFKSVYNIPFFGSDTFRFIDGSIKLQNLDLISLQKSWGYLTYVLIFYLTDIFFNSNYNLIILYQIFINYLSSIFLFYLTKQIYNAKSAYLAFILYIGYLDIQRWNFILYSDSIFVSLLIISFYLLINTKNFRDIFFFAPIFILTICCRPHGILLILPIIVAILFIYNFNIKKIFIILTIIFLVAFVIFFNQINTILIDYNEWIKYFVNGQYIAEVQSNINLNINLECLQENFLRIIICGIYEEPMKLLKINFFKFYYFFFNIRPYWTDIHIFLNLVINSTILIFFIIYIFLYRAKSHNEYIIYSFLAVYCLSIIVTWNDYDGRFFNPIYPFLCIFSSKAVVSLYHKYLKNEK